MTGEELQEIRERWTRPNRAKQSIGQAWADIETLWDYIEEIEKRVVPVARSRGRCTSSTHSGRIYNL